VVNYRTNNNNYLSLRYSYKYDLVKFHLNKEMIDNETEVLINNYKKEHSKKVSRTTSVLLLLVLILLVLIILKNKNVIRIKERNNQEEIQ
jgi:cytoskeletal protein RodZ